ncbi:Succinate-semialdehyde dehydrogenase [NADP(+)] [Planctomycetes bacterium Poly30]|uniref:Succinate-semialdehyde dehydrogenase [NADP(+)] n=1 Tax=Saltatorellus ferox TaxID=2528018 RepID=A0A518ESA1_9BACT|nr:Succinate-semialdehyde dehydrogenase [NADP(+)] [Planctomycetes bacterium Poly30]
MASATSSTDTSFLSSLGIQDQNQGAYNGSWIQCTGEVLESRSPATGELIASVQMATSKEYEAVVAAAQEAFQRWRAIPAPLRGDIVRRMGNAMREHKDALGRLITLEMGKSVQEGWGEVQECIDIADFAVGLSRQLYGLTMPSERPGHAMREQWHPLGTIGILTAFNFPMAVWAWNSMLAFTCGDACVWKPSPKTPLTAIGLTNVIRPILEAEGFGALAGLAIGGNEDVAQAMIDDARLPLISFTGSTAIGKLVASRVAGRMGRLILECGGNNGLVVLDDADLDMVLPATLFGAVGTAGQRCTSTRRLLVHESLVEEVTNRLVRAYDDIVIGDPMDQKTLCGPLIDEHAVETMMASIESCKKEGGKLLRGGERAKLDGDLAGGHYVTPAIMTAENHYQTVQHETFAPILYIIPIKDLEHAIEVHNGVPQGLSSAIFTNDMKAAERFISAVGSDCGIANVNIGTSGAEIGGAFGGEKDTGGGRESGSDAWKSYMRRQTNTVNYTSELPLAQGIKFG